MNISPQQPAEGSCIHLPAIAPQCLRRLQLDRCTCQISYYSKFLTVNVKKSMLNITTLRRQTLRSPSSHKAQRTYLRLKRKRKNTRQKYVQYTYNNARKRKLQQKKRTTGNATSPTKYFAARTKFVAACSPRQSTLQK